MRIQSESFSVASKVVHTAASILTRLHGNFLGTTADRWLQAHDAKELPANTAVPRRSWPLYNAGSGTPTPFDITDLKFAIGVVFAVSSTRATLTASADTMDLFVDGESSFDNAGASVAGDYTTPDEVLQVWADANGPKKLLRLEVTDGNGVDTYVQIHAGDVPATNKIVASFLLAGTEYLDLFFGGGFNPARRINGTLYDGCTIAISSTQATYTPIGLDASAIKATYR